MSDWIDPDDAPILTAEIAARAEIREGFHDFERAPEVRIAGGDVGDEGFFAAGAEVFKSSGEAVSHGWRRVAWPCLGDERAKVQSRSLAKFFSENTFTRSLRSV